MQGGSGASPVLGSDAGSSTTAELWRQPSRMEKPKKRLGTRLKSLFSRKK